ncbi:RagB/SusD family nutrient uptake outer membrane protein [Chitinophaga agrisoli]|uniref:RagB/SusD family nutrient uptake outer membrane protein n=1 Tax=Chitinophaga agrisoli TaxID=2607653 RepID=A0A5B2VMH0_9BACT|nr:RagB/SusD family nutrient uptake outer membrane protein [Chitinophaga agrisoli]KAA2240833.1 RagB/SusD family nutrient uptake outer membrane protein [Chitinophaga agrisoli]
MKNICTYIFIIAAWMSAASCSKFLEEKTDDFDFLTPDNFPQTEKDAELLLDGTLGKFRGQNYYDRAYYFLAEVSGELVNSNATTGSRYDFDAYTWLPNNEYLVNLWGTSYSIIDGANTMIAKVPVASQITAQKKSWYTSAGRFIRALAYFNLVRNYGKLPLISAPITDPNQAANLTRSEIGEVYKLIEEDLKFASDSLPVSWPDNLPGRPDRGSARGLLAKVYATMAGEPLKDNSKWAAAASYAKMVIDEGHYELLPDFSALWKVANNNNKESIFAIQYYSSGTGVSVMSVQSRPANVNAESGWDYWSTTVAFMNEFPDTDKRKAATFLTTMDNKNYPAFSAGKPYINKWIDAGRSNFKDNNLRTNLNVPVVRFADVLLTYAEAENEAAGPANAYAALNRVRDRAGLPALSGLTQAQFRDSVRKERTHEMAFEYNRRYDLIRWGQLTQVMGADSLAKKAYTPQKALYPIPENELLLNPKLGQNDGY